MSAGPKDDYEEYERALDPHRAEAERAAAREAADRLRERGVRVTGDEPMEALADLLDAVERFEAMVETHGGDLMVDSLKSSRPDDPHFVLPERGPKEGIRQYTERIAAATDRLRRHPRKPD
jgi:hypothetical protein